MPITRTGYRRAIPGIVAGTAAAVIALAVMAIMPGAQAPARAAGVTHQINSGAVSRNLDGRLEVFALGSDGAVWQDTQSTANASTWSGWSSLGGTVNATPVSGQEPDGRLAVFDSDSSGQIVTDVQTAPGSATWSGWSSLGGAMLSGTVADLSVVKSASGQLNLFDIGASNDSVQWNAQTTPGGSWGGWTSLGLPSGGVQPQFAQLRAIQNTDGRLEVFAVSQQTTPYYDLQASPGGAWGGWTAFGATGQTHSVSVARNVDDRVEIVSWQVTTNGVLDNAQNGPDGSWLGWTSLPSVSPDGPPLLAQNQDGRLEAFVTSSNGNIYRDWQSSPGGSWVGWASLGTPAGTLSGSVAALTNADGRLQAFATSSGAIWTTGQTTPGEGYGSWVSLG